jgi:hypothetical protein
MFVTWCLRQVVSSQIGQPKAIPLASRPAKGRADAAGGTGQENKSAI